MMNTSSQLTKMKRKPFYILVHIIPDIKSRIMLDINKMIDKRLIFCILFQGLTSLTPTPNDQPQDVRSNLDRLLSDPRFDKNSEQKNDVISWIEVRNENPFFFSFFFQKGQKDKTLGNRLSMSEMDPLNHKQLDFAIQSGLALHQFQLKLLLKHLC